VAVLAAACAFGADHAASARHDGPSPPTSSGTLPQPVTAKCGRSQTIHLDATFSYTLCYPAGWRPSRNRYANAFEIRKPIGTTDEVVHGSVSLVSTYTANDRDTAANRFLDGLLRQDNALPLNQRRLTISGYRAVRVERSMPAAVLGPGAGASGAASSSGPTKSVRFLGLYAAVGRYIIGVEASVPQDAGTPILNEVRQIQRRLRVTPASSP
jgi:hypothetical protein